MPSHHFTSLRGSSTQPWPCGSLPFVPLPRPCGSSPSQSGLCRHGAVQLTAVLCPRNSYPRNSMPSQVQPYQCSAVAPADHYVTVHARPSQCRSDHLMTPAFRPVAKHRACGALDINATHCVRLANQSRLSPWLISPASCCTAAALCPSRPSPSVPCPSCPVQMPSHRHAP